ncbi:MAG: hypothetical protein NC337_06825 [Roseburia sp.]|nr:hypothetical protein [Roseburia sp.]
MRINYNISSIVAKNAANNNDMRMTKSIQRLSSGLKINKGSDDAAGLAISRKLNAQIRSMQRANQNANDGVSVVNTADGAMAEIHDILQRMNELAIQSANGTNANSDRAQIQKEIDQLLAEIDRIADTTQFNAQNLLDGTFAYKGYTNTENVTVMSYDDGVTTGVYNIKSITYCCYDETMTYGDENEEVRTKKRYEVSSADDVQNALVTKTELASRKQASANPKEYDGHQGFPDGSKVTLDDENIIIKAENNFEVKLALNNRNYMDTVNTTSTSRTYTGINTTTVSRTYTAKVYEDVAVTDDKGVSYTISELTVLSNVDKNPNSAVEVRHPEQIHIDFAEGEVPDNWKITTTTVTATATAGEYEISLEIVNGEGQKENRTITVDASKAGESGKHTKTIETIETTYVVGGVDADGNNTEITLDMTGMGPMIIQVGANEGQILKIDIPALNTINLGVDELELTTEDKATAAIDTIGKAINMLSSVRAKIGAYTNRLERTITNLDTSEENMTAAYSRIMDVDMAEEMTEYTTVQVLVQASTAMLAQSNERPQQVLQLLQ